MSKVFISYVREDTVFVDFLVSILERNGVEVWLDRNDLAPGLRWKDAIRTAISSGTFFVSVHSKHRESKSVSYVHEELVLAIEELRKRSSSTAWFIPVVIDDCKIEDRAIGGGETLNSLQYCDLRKWPEGIRRLLNALGVESPIVDSGVPLADGLPSVVSILGGFIRYDDLPGAPPLMQGIEFRVADGWCQREEDGSILAYIETVAPLRPLQEINRMLGLSGFHAKSDVEKLSRDAGYPTKFSYSQEYIFLAGTDVPDLTGVGMTKFPIDFPVETFFDAYGYVDGERFLGDFEARIVSKLKYLPINQVQRGKFEVLYRVND